MYRALLKKKLCMELKERSINIAIISETKKTLRGTEDLDGFTMDL